MKKEEGFYIEERRKSPQRSMVYRNQCSRGVYSFINRNINWMDDRNTDCRLLPRHDTAGMADDDQTKKELTDDGSPSGR